MKPIISITDCTTQETIEREMTDAEYEQHLITVAKIEEERPVAE